MNSTASGGDGTRSSPWSGWQGLVGLCLIASIAIGSFVVMSAKLNHAVNPPLDDSYIYYQYAKQIARGQLFRYQDGDQVSTGSSSILYPILVAPFWLAGMRDKAIFWGGYWVNAAGLLPRTKYDSPMKIGRSGTSRHGILPQVGDMGFSWA